MTPIINMYQPMQQVLRNYEFEAVKVLLFFKKFFLLIFILKKFTRNMSNPNEESQQQQQLQVLNLFERVTEPFTPKPDIVFDIVQPIPGDPFNIPELELVKAIPRGSLFSSFHPGHREAAYTLIRIFKSKQILYSPKRLFHSHYSSIIGLPTVQDMINLAATIRDDCNEHLYVFALSAAIIQRPDARALRIPPIFEVFPDKFIGRKEKKFLETLLRPLFQEKSHYD